MKIAGIGNDSTALANKTTKKSPVVGNCEIYVLYIATLFETIILFGLDVTPRIFLPDKIEGKTGNLCSKIIKITTSYTFHRLKKSYIKVLLL